MKAKQNPKVSGTGVIKLDALDSKITLNYKVDKMQIWLSGGNNFGVLSLLLSDQHRPGTLVSETKKVYFIIIKKFHKIMRNASCFYAYFKIFNAQPVLTHLLRFN